MIFVSRLQFFLVPGTFPFFFGSKTFLFKGFLLLLFYFVSVVVGVWWLSLENCLCMFRGIRRRKKTATWCFVFLFDDVCSLHVVYLYIVERKKEAFVYKSILHSFSIFLFLIIFWCREIDIVGMCETKIVFVRVHVQLIFPS